MPLMTEALAREIRLANSEVAELAPKLQIRIGELSASAALGAEALQADIAAGKKTKTDLFRFMLTNACLTVDGALLTDDDAGALLSTLSVTVISKLVADINTKIGKKPEAAPPGKD